MDAAADSFSLSECEVIWQKTLSLTDFDPAVLEHQLTRNAQPAYGLTLVADYPLPDDVLASIERLRQVCREVLGGGIKFLSDAHLHLTVYSLLRSRNVPLPEEELAATWACWLPRLAGLAGELASLVITLRGLSVTSTGAVLVCGTATDDLRWLQGQVSRLPGVAAPRDIPPHVTIGQVERPCGKAGAFDAAMMTLHHYAAEPVGTLRFNRLHVLYYCSRLLDQVLRSTAIPLGQRE